MTTELTRAIMQSQGMTEEEALGEIKEAKAEFQRLLDDGDTEEAQEICFDRWGLEPDYLLELMD